MKEVPASDKSAGLDAEVQAFLRDRFTIESARYYVLPGDVPWLAVSKSVENQMAERSIRRTIFEWYEPGLDFVEVYPQGDAEAFAVAMPKDGPTSEAKLIGFYRLGNGDSGR